MRIWRGAMMYVSEQQLGRRAAEEARMYRIILRRLQAYENADGREWNRGWSGPPQGLLLISRGCLLVQPQAR